MNHPGAGHPCPAPSNSGRVAPLRGCHVVRAPDLRITVIGAPSRQVVRSGSSAGKDAGGALVRRATDEPAGCGRLPRHPAARRAALKLAGHRTAFPSRAGRMPAVGLASRDSLCEPQDAASGARPADNDELWASLSPE